MKLKDLGPEETGIITEIHLTGLMKRRLIDMGVTAGTVMTMLRTAPLGDPVEYSVLGYNLCLRRSDADKIHIERLDVNGENN